MKARILFCLLTIIAFVSVTQLSHGQYVNEEEILSLDAGMTADPWGVSMDNNTGTMVYIKYDASDNMYTMISNGKESAKYGYVSNYDIKFDSKGNYYVIASMPYDENYLSDYVLVVNGDSITSFKYAESYSSIMTKSDEFKFPIKTGNEETDKYKLVTYSMSGGMRESEEYETVKLIYKGVPYNYDGEDHYDTGYNPNYFLDKDGNNGYVVSDGITASLMFGDNITRTSYTDIDAASFIYDKYGQLCFVAKNGAMFYTQPGNEFLVQGSTEYPAFDYVYGPIQFTSDNKPVYTVVDYENDYKSVYMMAIGGEAQKVYRDKEKKLTAPEFTGGVYDIRVEDNGNITYYGSVYGDSEEGKESIMYKTAYVVNGVMSELYPGMGMIKKNNRGEMITVISPNGDYYSQDLIRIKGDKSEKINKEKFTSIADYGFSKNGEMYYIGMKEGDYEKRIKPEYYVNLNGLLIGKYETLLYQGMGDNYDLVKFNSRGDYAFAVSKFYYYEDYPEGQIPDASAYVITNSGKQDPKIIAPGSSKSDFDYIDFMFYTKNDKLFYIGGISMYPQNISYSQLVIDGKSPDNIYNSYANLYYDEVSNVLTFIGSRDNKLYNVRVDFN